MRRTIIESSIYIFPATPVESTIVFDDVALVVPRRENVVADRILFPSSDSPCHNVANMERIWKANVMVPSLTERTYVDVNHIAWLHDGDGKFIHAADFGICLLNIIDQEITP